MPLTVLVWVFFAFIYGNIMFLPVIKFWPWVAILANLHYEYCTQNATYNSSNGILVRLLLKMVDDSTGTAIRLITIPVIFQSVMMLLSVR
jgi:hypothetical protein